MQRFIIITSVFVFLVTNPSPTSAQQAKQDSVIAARFNRAVGLYETHDDSGEALEEAEKEFAAVLKLNPRHAPARAYQGLIALGNQKPEVAEAAFRDALGFDPNCPEARVGRVRLFRQRRQWAESYKEAHLAVQLAPTSILARWELVSVLLHRAEAPVTDAERTEATPHLQKIIDLDPDARQAHLVLAELYERQKRLRDAITHYNEVLRIGQTEEDMDVWVYEINNTVAGCYERLGDYPQAIEFLKQYLDALKELGADEETLKATEQRIAELQKKSSGKNR